MHAQPRLQPQGLEDGSNLPAVELCGRTSVQDLHSLQAIWILQQPVVCNKPGAQPLWQHLLKTPVVPALRYQKDSAGCCVAFEIDQNNLLWVSAEMAVQQMCQQGTSMCRECRPPPDAAPSAGKPLQDLASAVPCLRKDRARTKAGPIGHAHREQGAGCREQATAKPPISTIPRLHAVPSESMPLQDLANACPCSSLLAT